MRALGSLVSATLVLSLLGCALDERTLPIASSQRRDAAPPPSEPPDSDSMACPDLDRDGAPDCAATLVANPSFDVGAERWELDAASAQAWSPEDVRDPTTSGSIFVSSLVHPADQEPSARGSHQCVMARAGVRYRAYAEMLSDSAQGAPRGTLTLRFYLRPGCVGRYEDVQSPRNDEWDTWTLLTADAIAPPDTQSVLVRLLSASSDLDTPSGILFDEILVTGLD
jgi:hypothetical protein